MNPLATLNRMRREADARIFGGLIVLLVLITLFWGTLFVWPLKILVVVFHELSHALAVILTGGRVDHIAVVAREGGYCLSAGGNAFLTLSAGYLGSLLWGGLILISAVRSRAPAKLSMLLGILLIAVSLLLMRPVIGFGFIFSLFIGTVLILLSRHASAQVNRLVLSVAGLTSLLYAPLDIVTDVLWHPRLPSDARMLAELTHIPTVLWGLVWTALALFGSAYFILAASARREMQIPPPR